MKRRHRISHHYGMTIYSLEQIWEVRQREFQHQKGIGSFLESFEKDSFSLWYVQDWCRAMAFGRPTP